MLDTPFAPWPQYDEEEAAAVAAVLRSNRVNYWTGGEGRAFEAEFARWTGSRHAIALANGTLAIDLALKALGIGPGDEVVVTPRTFIASASAIVNAGATPVFADVDPDSGNIGPDTIAPAISERTRALLVVHLGGWPADMPAIGALAARHGLRVIEDCAQAHGARVGGKSVGTWGDIGAWSFCQDKIMTTGGEGGMVTTDDPGLWSAMWSYKDHGKDFDAVARRDHPPGFRWVHDSFGTNMRMTEMQAVLGRIQLGRMARWTARRNAHAQAIQSALMPLAGADGPVRLAIIPPFKPDDPAAPVHACYRYYAYVRPQNLKPGWTRDRIVAEIAGQGVPCFQGSCPEVYREKAFEGTGLRPGTRLPIARELGETSLMFLVHPSLTDAEAEKTGAVAARILERAAR